LTPTTMKKKSLTIMRPPLLLATLFALFSVSCDKSKERGTQQGFNPPQAVQGELVEPNSPVDIRQANENMTREIKALKTRMDQIEGNKDFSGNQKKEMEAILSEMTTAMEKLDRRCGELERENQTLRTLIDSVKSGGFQQ
jgi:septal ring factor EnvC (AmiA/AmiB activator)